MSAISIPVVFQRRVFFNLWIQICILLTAGLWLIFEPEGEAAVYWLSVFLMIQFVWSFWSWYRVTGSLFDPYTIFLLAAVLFNGGKAILEVFHLNQNGIENFFSNDGYLIFSFPLDTIMRSLLLVSLGLGGFHLGALLAANKKCITPTRNFGKSGREMALRVVGWAFIVVSFIPLVITLRDSYQVALSSGYFGLFQRQAETGLGATPRVLADFMIPGVFFLLAGARRRQRPAVLTALIITAYAAIQAFTGTRLWWAMPLVAYVWLWHRCVTPIPKPVLIVGGAFVLFVVFPIIMAVRNIPGVERLSLSVFLTGFFSLQNPVLSILNEMGGTLLTVAHTLELVPRIRDFDWGVGYAYSLLTVFPNLFWEIHPTVARGLYAHWLTATISPATFYAGGGYGFSFIAEAYANFGWVGTPLALAAIGFLFARVVLWALRSDDPARLATVASFMAFFLIYARGESASVVRPLIWYAFLPYFLVQMLKSGGMYERSRGA